MKRLKISRVKSACSKAFTLAETLIVIGINGVVAALTLPNLNHATGDKEKVTKVKKIYSSLTDAFDRAQVIYGNIDEWCNDDDYRNGVSCNERLAKRVTEFMKISKDCGFEAGCFSSAPYLRLDADGADNLLEFMQTDSRDPQYMVMLSDGTSLGFYYGRGYVALAKVDIDGPNKGKNQDGTDIFNFHIGLRESNGATYPYLQLIPDSLHGGVGDYDSCYDIAKWVIENGNLDYLKCPDELNWETQTSCK